MIVYILSWIQYGSHVGFLDWSGLVVFAKYDWTEMECRAGI